MIIKKYPKSNDCEKHELVFFKHARTIINNGDHLAFLRQVLGMVHNPEADDHHLH